MPSAADVLPGLLADPAALPTTESEIPDGPGLYAWWKPANVLPYVVGPQHSTLADHELLYVGIAGGLRQRVVRRHISGGTGGSTLRRALAALLLDAESLTTRWTSTRVVLLRDDERRLTTWMRTHLRVTWCPHPLPRTVERAVIAALQPPLNQEHNTAHPAYSTVRAARARLRASAGAKPSR